ncbi:uncharacterized protein LOC142770618, partial [Rhipicephalus microplus]|uniref:uncharacterized protein LOC142770618 n=1 Tax=Rhipicephalus microplus TaxID=6941 RepID=UPI003F6CCE76
CYIQFRFLLCVLSPPGGASVLYVYIRCVAYNKRLFVWWCCRCFLRLSQTPHWRRGWDKHVKLPSASSVVRVHPAISFSGLAPPPPFLPTPGRPSLPWEKWAQTLTVYLQASGAAEFPPARRKAILLHCLGAEGQRVYRTLPARSNAAAPASAAAPEVQEKPPATATDEYEAALIALRQQFSTTCNVVVERHRFHRRSQHAGESVHDFVAALRELVSHCSFASQDDALRDQFVAGVVSNRVRERLLLEGSSFSIESAVRIALQFEQAAEELKEFSGSVEPVSVRRRSQYSHSSRKFNFQPKAHFQQNSPSASGSRAQQGPRPPRRGRHSRLLSLDIIERIDASEWVLPIVVVDKKDGTIRICVDLREPNKAIVPGSFPLPHTEELLHALATTGVAPAVLLHGRMPRTRLNVVGFSAPAFAKDPAKELARLRQRVRLQQQSSKEYTDRRRAAKQPKIATAEHGTPPSFPGFLRGARVHHTNVRSYLRHSFRFKCRSQPALPPPPSPGSQLPPPGVLQSAVPQSPAPDPQLLVPEPAMLQPSSPGPQSQSPGVLQSSASSLPSPAVQHPHRPSRERRPPVWLKDYQTH